MSLFRRASASVLCALFLAAVCATPAFAKGNGAAAGTKTGHHHKHKHKHKHGAAAAAHAKHAKKKAK